MDTPASDYLLLRTSQSTFYGFSQFSLQPIWRCIAIEVAMVQPTSAVDVVASRG